MADYFEKLGNLLNEALKNGEIPQDEKKTNNFNTETNNFSQDKESKQKIKDNISQKKNIPTGEVVKLHKYTTNIQFPFKIQNALTTLDIVYPFTIRDIKIQYHKLLKQNHPDTKSTIQTSKNVSKNRQINDIQDAYRILKEYFSV